MPSLTSDSIGIGFFFYLLSHCSRTWVKGWLFRKVDYFKCKWKLRTEWEPNLDPRKYINGIFIIFRERQRNSAWIYRLIILYCIACVTKRSATELCISKQSAWLNDDVAWYMAAVYTIDFLHDFIPTSFPFINKSKTGKKITRSIKYLIILICLKNVKIKICIPHLVALLNESTVLQWSRCRIQCNVTTVSKTADLHAVYNLEGWLPAGGDDWTLPRYRRMSSYRQDASLIPQKLSQQTMVFKTIMAR